jgi:hypothetical protein
MGLLRTALAACVLATGYAGCGADAETPSAETRTGPQAETAVAERERSTGDGATATQAQSGRLRLARVGRFASPLTVTSPPGDRRRLFVVEQGGRIRVVRGGRVLRRPFLDVSRQIVSGGEQGLLGLAFAPDYARLAALLRALHRTGPATRAWSSTARGVRRPTSPTRRPHVSCSPRTSRSPTTTAASSRSGPTACCTWASATAAVATTCTARAATRSRSAPCSARSSGSTRARRAAGRTGSPRATRSRGAGARGARSTATACATRGASRSTARPAT